MITPSEVGSLIGFLNSPDVVVVWVFLLFSLESFLLVEVCALDPLGILKTCAAKLFWLLTLGWTSSLGLFIRSHDRISSSSKH